MLSSHVICRLYKIQSVPLLPCRCTFPQSAVCLDKLPPQLLTDSFPNVHIMMAFILIALAFATGVNSSQCSSTCCFGLTASGGQTGTVCQLDDGQTRIGGGLAPAEFCINGTTIEDSAGRGCIITRWSLVFPFPLLLLWRGLGRS